MAPSSGRISGPPAGVQSGGSSAEERTEQSPITHDTALCSQALVASPRWGTVREDAHAGRNDVSATERRVEEAGRRDLRAVGAWYLGGLIAMITGILVIRGIGLLLGI